MRILILLLLVGTNLHPVETEEDEEFKPNKEKLIQDTKTKIEISRLSQIASNQIREKKYKEADKTVKEIFELSEFSVDYYYLKACIHYSNSEFQSALQFLGQALKFNNAHDPSYFLVGMIYAKKNDWEKALPYLEKANKEGAYNPYYRINLSIAHFQLEQFDMAAKVAKATLELKENYLNAKIIYLKSLVKLSKKDAWFQIQDIIEKKQDLTPFYSIYIQLLFEHKKNYSEIIKEFSKKTNLSLDEKKYLAYSYFKDGEANKSYNIYKSIINLEKDSEEDLQNYFRLLIFLNKDSEAEKVHSALVKDDFDRRKFYQDFLNNQIHKREILKFLYTPIIMR